MDALVATGRSLSRSGPSEDFLALLTETVNTEAHDVARLEILRRLHAEAHSRRGPVVITSPGMSVKDSLR
jgi:hypothetical protein